MKSKLLLISILLLCMMGQVSGEVVNEDKARIAAQNWYRHYAPENKKSAAVASFSEYKHNERTAFYIYNFDQGGFVLVSANDAVTPVLGYGFDHAAPVEIASESVKGWFDSYARQIDTAFVLNLKSNEMEAKWQEVLENRISVKNGTTVNPLLTTTWGQGWPYNSMCPSNPAGPGGHVWAGCVATAMAQIMKYHNYPSQGLGSYGYQWQSYPYTGANFGTTTYNWSNMPNSISSVNTDVATITYHAAVSTFSMWGAGSTGVGWYDDQEPMTRAFVNYFRMAYSSLEYVKKVNYSTTDWYNLLDGELLANRPVYYRGNGTGGHAWVCDGVDANTMYHFNWGWDGMYNGYYSLSAINPGGQNFNENQCAIIGIQANDGSTLVSNTTWSGNINHSNKIAVPDAITLTVQPGSNILFGGGAKLQVYGRLLSIGTANNYVRFSSIDTNNRWHGIKWDNEYNWYDVMADNDSSKLIYTQVEYSGNSGLYASRFGKILIKNSKISNNNSGHGGGIFVDFNSINIWNSEIYKNHASMWGGGIFIQHTQDGASNICQNDIYDNMAAGGALTIFYGNANVIGNTIRENQAIEGAGVAIYDSSPLVENNILVNNSASSMPGDYGVLYLANSNANIVGNLIANNNTSGIYIRYGSAPTIVNSTIVNNYSYYAAGMVFDQGSDPVIKNCIIYDNIAQDPSQGSQIRIIDADSDPVFDHCDIQGGLAGFGGAGAGSNYNPANYTNNINADPIFVDPTTGAGAGYDGLLADYSVQGNSPCIDAGTTSGIINILPALDLAGNPRINGIIDMGSYEYCSPAQPSAITGDTNPCQGAAQEYSVTNVSGVTYTWTVPSGSSITNGQGSNAITVVFGAVSGNVSVVPSNLCGNGMSRTLGVTVNSIPAQPSNIGGYSNPCQGATQSYFVTAIAGMNYNWSVPSDWTIVSGQGTNSISALVGSIPGNITVTPSNNCGSGSSRTLAVTVNHAPGPASAINGNIAPCQGANTSYSVNNVSGITFSWTVPSGWTIVSGQGSNSITLNVGSNPGTITVTPNNACGSGGSSSLALEVNHVPDQTSEIIGNTNPCEGYTGIYSVTQLEGITYTWTVPPGATILDGQGSNAIVVNMGTSSGNIIVTPSNLCGNGLESSLFVTVNHPPSETPSQASGPETVNSFNTAASLYTTNAVPNTNYYLWDLYPAEAGVLSPENDTSVTITWNTGFTGNCALVVKAVNNCGESPFSVPIIIYVDYLTSLFELNTPQINIYPNPSNGRFTIQAEKISQLCIFDIYGRMIDRKIFTDAIEILTLYENYQSGVYFLQVFSGDKSEIVKVIIK